LNHIWARTALLKLVLPGMVARATGWGHWGEGAPLATVTVTEAEVVVLPPVSRATAVRVRLPSATVVVFQATE
jgi:hypothetical protein